MTNILLTRHGHVEGINPQRFRGRYNVPLSEQGVVEAHAVATRIAAEWKPIAVYTSPMQRCIDTGEAIADACHIGSSVLDTLTDIDYGTWQWKTHAEIEEEFPHLFATWFAAPELVRFPEGDSLQDLVARTAEAIRTIHSRHPRETVVLVGHDSVNRAILMQMLDQPLSAYWRLEQSPCCLNQIDFSDNHIRVERINDTSHHSRLWLIDT
ncbi:MAG: histidine phosphatase family protein [Rhizomicrobium sp.]|jgi:phosphoserine phosphatase